MATSKKSWRWRRTAHAATSWGVAEFFVYVLLAVASTWPLARSLESSLPLGTGTAATVPLFTTWTVWWNADRASHGYGDYWDAPIFHPATDTFAFSEPMPTTVLVAPLFWLSSNRLLTHNAFLLLAIVLNGWSCAHLLRCVGVGILASALGGAMIVLLPMVHNELGVLQLVPLFGILWTVHGLLRFGQRPGPARAVWLGLAFAFTYLTCAYYGLFLSVLLMLAGGWLVGKQLLNRRTWTVLPVAAGVALALIAPVVAAQLRIARQHGLVRSRGLVSRLSARPADYLATPWPQWIEPATIRERRETTHLRLGPGIIKIGLAVLGAGLGLARRRYRAWTAFCLTMLFAAWALSLGPDLRLGNWSPYGTLMDWYPGFAQVRSPFRFAMFVQVMTVLLAIVGVREAGRVAGNVVRTVALHPPCLAARRRHLAAVASAAGFVVAAAAVMEVLPDRQATYSPPPLAAQRGWISWLQDNTPPGCAIACLPFPDGNSVRCYEPTALWMYWSTFHRRRLVNGYSGFLPENYIVTKQQAESFPDAVSLRRLREQGAAYCVVDRSSLPRHGIEQASTARHRLLWVYGDDDAGVDIYRLEPQ